LIIKSTLSKQTINKIQVKYRLNGHINKKNQSSIGIRQALGLKVAGDICGGEDDCDESDGQLGISTGMVLLLAATGVDVPQRLSTDFRGCCSNPEGCWAERDHYT
jgi:hypothetical protein